jgi:hypothetical protein
VGVIVHINDKDIMNTTVIPSSSLEDTDPQSSTENRDGHRGVCSRPWFYSLPGAAADNSDPIARGGKQDIRLAGQHAKYTE